jgi:hypothetical protein
VPAATSGRVYVVVLCRRGTFFKAQLQILSAETRLAIPFATHVLRDELGRRGGLAVQHPLSSLFEVKLGTHILGEF